MGRQLASLTKDGITYNYRYNVDGLRTYKSDGETAYSYTWEDGKLISQTGANNTIKFIYEGDKPTAINYNGTEYYYVTNLQGDVIAILDSNGTCVVEYTYDAWGKVLFVTGSMASTLGSNNPLRYRGYYYDIESDLYYLQSRYYDPSVGRFINADEIGYLGANGTVPSYNLFAYCENNPVNKVDFTGCLAWKIKISVIGGIAYGLYKTASLVGMRMKSWREWAILGLTFVKGFLVGFFTVYSFFSISKKTAKALAFGILNTVGEFILGNIKNAKDLLEAFIDGYGGYLSPSIIKNKKLGYIKDIVIYLNRYFCIKVY